MSKAEPVAPFSRRFPVALWATALPAGRERASTRRRSSGALVARQQAGGRLCSLLRLLAGRDVRRGGAHDDAGAGANRYCPKYFASHAIQRRSMSRECTGSAGLCPVTG